MIKGIIEEVIDDYSYRVRIPMYDKPRYTALATPTDELSIGYACVQPGCAAKYFPDDVVYVVTNEDGALVIVGEPYNETPTGVQSIRATSLRVDGDTVLSKGTSIGDIDYKKLSYLSNVESDIQDQLTNMGDAIASKNIGNTIKFIGDDSGNTHIKCKIGLSNGEMLDLSSGVQPTTYYGVQYITNLSVDSGYEITSFPAHMWCSSVSNPLYFRPKDGFLPAELSSDTIIVILTNGQIKAEEE